MDDELRASYEKALIEEKASKIAAKLTAVDGSSAGKRFAGAVRLKKQFDAMFGDITIVAPANRVLFKGRLRNALREVDADEEADLTPSPPSSQDETMTEDPAGGRKRKTRKHKRKTRKHTRKQIRK